ncbi:MAG: RnfABCDGE type electron transport complex subunit B [Peptoniphilaceae bacterium]|nr:RnfABCDGE type electron transport complex subunit B [Peptoniphilaceae bacterium]MDD7383327.1 RnfABCDGE type electron transport complex subunit B [Peptoniphilaceae bacterium]MDY3738302.1 RnfABCDGE type electron transport complex subunit B [Peptoniphilaceae bacterium]
MNIGLIITPVVVLAIMGFVFAFLLGIVSEKFYVEVDLKQKKVREVLPGANCGACGYPGCDGCAAAIANKEAPASACVIGGADVAAKVAEAIGEVADFSQEKKLALVKCNGDCNNSVEKFHYEGIKDCRAMISYFGGSKACSYGCLGCGSCVDACEFDAIHIKNNIAVVDRNKCVACGACVKICPKNIIELVPESMNYAVLCMSQDKGKDVRSNCKVGCIGCRICSKTYPEAFEINSNLSKETGIENPDMSLIDEAINKCPMNSIHKLN